MVFLVRLLIDLDPADEGPTDCRNDQPYDRRQQEAHRNAEVQLEVFQALEQRYKRDDETDEKHIDRAPSLGVPERIVRIQNETANAEHKQKGDRAANGGRHNPAGDNLAYLVPLDGIQADARHGKSDDCANDRMCGRDRPPARRRKHQPDRRGQQGCQHTEHEDFRIADYWARVDDAFPDCRGDVTAGQRSAAELEDSRNDNRTGDRDCSRPDGRAHDVGNVVGADAPSHIQAEDDRNDQKDRSICCNDFHSVVTPPGTRQNSFSAQAANADGSPLFPRSRPSPRSIG